MKTVEFEKLSINIDTNDSVTIYTFNGDISEHFAHNKLPYFNTEQTVLVLDYITTFNSIGTREWIHFVDAVSQNSTPVFRNCSVAMIDQINMVPECLGKGFVESFYAPYFCDCGEEVNKLVSIKENIDILSNSTAPEFSCDACGKTLEFDALEESYFQFINSSSKAG